MVNKAYSDADEFLSLTVINHARLAGLGMDRNRNAVFTRAYTDIRAMCIIC
jgi:hypothetical protein